MLNSDNASKKKLKDLVEGDIIQVQCGENDIMTYVAVTNVELLDDKWCKLYLHYPYSKQTKDMYGLNNAIIEVIGTER